MTTVTQTMRYRQALIKYSQKHGVTKAAIRYKTNRQHIYRWLRRYDETIQSLADKSHKPHHPNQHTEAEQRRAEVTPITEKLYRTDSRSEREFKETLKDYMHDYNTARPHSELKYKTPNEYETIYFEKSGNLREW